MNNKGFMMAEVIVVSAVILVTLVGLYTSYNKIFAVYNQRIDYYDINTLYKLSNIRDNYLYPSVVNTKKVDGKTTVYYVNKNLVKNKTVDTNGLNQTFKDYLDYLSTSLDFNSMIINERIINNLLIMEDCNDDNNNCKYAYLEVLDDDAVLPPKCSLSVSGTTITATVNREDRISYMGWDLNKVNDNGILTKTIDSVGTYTFTIVDTDENLGTCSVSVSSYSSVSSETKNCISSTPSSACSRGFSYVSGVCNPETTYTTYYGSCNAATNVWDINGGVYKSGLTSCGYPYVGSSCNYLDGYGQESLVCVAKTTYSGEVFCKKYACEVNGHTRISGTNYCYKIN